MLRMVEPQFKQVFHRSFEEVNPRKNRVRRPQRKDDELPGIEQKLANLLNEIFPQYCALELPREQQLTHMSADAWQLYVKDCGLFKTVPNDIVLRIFDDTITTRQKLLMQKMLEARDQRKAQSKLLHTNADTNQVSDCMMDRQTFLAANEEMLKETFLHQLRKSNEVYSPEAWELPVTYGQALTPQGQAKRRALRRLTMIYKVYRLPARMNRSHRHATRLKIGEMGGMTARNHQYATGGQALQLGKTTKQPETDTAVQDLGSMGMGSLGGLGGGPYSISKQDEGLDA